MKFAEERKQRYHSKIGYILEKMYALPDTASVVDDLVVDGILYRVQTSIDAAIDMAAMLVKDIGIDVSEDYDNIEILCRNEIFDINLADDLKKQQEELIDKNKELRNAHKRLTQSEKLAATGKLAAGIAHEINNPLQGITSSLKMVKDLK